MTHSSILAVAAVLTAALAATPASAKVVKRGHHQARVHHHVVGPAGALGAFGAVQSPGYYGGAYRGYGDSPAATGGGSLGYNRDIHNN